MSKLSSYIVMGSLALGTLALTACESDSSPDNDTTTPQMMSNVPDDSGRFTASEIDQERHADRVYDTGSTNGGPGNE